MHCCPVDISIINKLTSIAIRTDEEIEESIPGNISVKEKNIMRNFMKRQVKIATNILSNPYTMHPINNAFKNIDFGANEMGILHATADDHMHSFESGFAMYLAQAAYQPISPSNATIFESVIATTLRASRSSVRDQFPQGKYSKGFSNLTLLTASEKIGMLFYLFIGLHNPVARNIFKITHEKQVEKYFEFPEHIVGSGTIKKNSGQTEYPLWPQLYFHDYDKDELPYNKDENTIEFFLII